MRLLFLLLCAVVVYGQSETRPAFLAADVHPSAMRRFPYASQPAVRNGLYEIRDASMVDLIAFAYGVRTTKVWGGPSWLEMDRFDITAKVPEKATREAQNQMLQALLEERFRLVAGPDTRPVLAYALVVEKKGLLKRAEGDGEKGCRIGQQNRPALSSGPQSPPAFDYACHGTTMQAFADFFMTIPRGQYMTDAPVVDKTGLEGAWDFDFKFTFRAMPGAGTSISILDALSKIGLKLESATVPLPVIAVASVNEKATPNPPETAKILGSQPALEFEVADIKPTDPKIRNRMIRNQAGGRVTMEGISLKGMIQQAWENLPDDMLADAPKWLDQDRWSMVAKAPAEAGRSVDFEMMSQMLQALLKERFGLQTHLEDRPVKAYKLTAVKPKMHPADPASRTHFREGAGADGVDPRDKNPVLTRLVTVQNMTMAQFAARLQAIASGYVHAPVLDATGILR